MQLKKLYLLIALFAPACVQAQWVHLPTPGLPRTADGKPKLSAPVPRTRDGKPDLTGIWEAEPAPREELMKMLPGGINGLGEDPPSKYFLNILADYPLDEAPLVPEAAATFQKRLPFFGRDFQVTRCLPAGVPNDDLLPVPFKILQTQNQIAMLFELDNSFRQIFTDGRQLPNDPSPSWLGYSVGKWEGDTLVVETIGLNDKAWLDAIGHTHSELLHVTERFHRRDFGHIEVELRLDDPKTFAKPVTIHFNERLVPDTELIETFCAEGEKDAAHMASAK